MTSKGTALWILLLALGLILLTASQFPKAGLDQRFAALDTTGTPGTSDSSTATLTVTDTVSSSDTPTATLDVTDTTTVTGTPTATGDITNTTTPTATVQMTDTLQTTGTPTATVTITATLTVTPTATRRPTVTPMPSATPKGDTNLTARAALGQTEYVAPNSSIWYRIDDGGMQLAIWIDANGQKDIAMSIYAPNQNVNTDKPIGRGAFNKFQANHDLYWSGYAITNGAWYAVVTNYNSVPVSYKLDYIRTMPVFSDSCKDCHTHSIPWDQCSSPGSAFCSNLFNGNQH